MNKRDLFYIVKIGTNFRLVSSNNKPLIIQKYKINEVYIPNGHKLMSIEEYESIFGE